MTPRPRLFIAATPGNEILEPLRDMIRALRAVYPAARWVQAERSHLTLAFLGETPGNRIEDIKDAMSEAARGAGAFAVSPGGAGAFPSWEHPRVAWFGLARGAKELRRLESALRDGLERRGFAVEKREFHPHLTLCRLERDGKRLRAHPETSRELAALRQEAEKLGEEPQWRSAVSRIGSLDLIESRLSAQGPAYSVIHRQPLEEA